MNVNTGEIRMLTAEQRDLLLGHFTPVPEEHQAEAKQILGDQESAFADMAAETPLVKWAKKQQRHKARKGIWARKRRRQEGKI